MKPTHDQLQEAYQALSQRQMAARYNTSTSTISRWLQQYKIEKRPHEHCVEKELEVSRDLSETIKKAYASGMSRTITAGHCGTTEHIVRRVLRGQFRQPNLSRELNRVRLIPPMAGIQLQCALGTLLGDASLVRTGNSYQLAATHGHPQRAYAAHKADILGAAVYEVTEKGSWTKHRRYRLSYYCKPELSKLADIVLINGRKTVTSTWTELLEPQAIAYWYMDDGSSSFTKKAAIKATFATESFSMAEIGLLRDRLSQMGISTSMPKKGKGFNISIRQRDINHFMDLVEPFMIPCLKYKIKRRLTPPRPSLIRLSPGGDN